VTVRPLADFPAVVTRAADRRLPLLPHITAVQGPDASVLPQTRRNLLPVTLPQGRVVPGPFTHEPWQRPYRLGIGACQGQRHRLDRLARPSQPQAVQGLRRPLTRCAARTQGTVEGVLRAQCLNQMVHGRRRQVHGGCHVHRLLHSALLR